MINVKNGFGYTPLAEARALENPKMDPIVHVLEKFKKEQDKIKVDSGENSILESKILKLEGRVTELENTLSGVVALGVSMKQDLSKKKDPAFILEKLADKLVSLDPQTSAQHQQKGKNATPAKSIFGLRSKSPKVKKQK